MTLSVSVIAFVALPNVARAQQPQSMVALGDSFTVGLNSCEQPGTFGCQQNSWATGTNPAVNSHAQRLRIAPENRRNVANGGDLAMDLNTRVDELGATRKGQVEKALNTGVKYQYVTILIGTNDTCTTRTDPAAFRAEIDTALAKLAAGLPTARIFVASIPDLTKLFDLYSNNENAFVAWKTINCRNFLTADAGAREGSREHLMELNRQLALACSAQSRCVFDGGAVFNWAIKDGYFASDYFHYSVQGEAALAAVTFGPAVASRRRPAKLKVKRASVRGGKLDVLLGVTGRATGDLEIGYQAGGQRSAFKVAVGPAQEGEKLVRIQQPLVGNQRRVRTGIMTATYRGNDAVYPDSLRSRAANGLSRLRTTQLSFGASRLRIQGTLEPRVRGVVRLRVIYARADGSAGFWRRQVRVANGRWAVDEVLPPDVAADPEAYLTTQFTGDSYAPGGPFRGEQDGKGLANLSAG